MKLNKKNINVTKTFLPKKTDFKKQIDEIWETNHLANNGPLHQRLNEKLKQHLKVKHLQLVNNGTIALQIAIKALDISGEVITTPFSYVASTSSIVWEGCKPVFADIDKESLCIDPDKVEPLITEKTTAILATHVYGNACDIEKIEQIAKKHSLKVIYDAAHCFGVKYKGRSIFEYGDISTTSFHATKVFHTGEGGAIFANNEVLIHKIWYKHNFGHKGKENFHGLGINAKMNELQAAMGLAVLPHQEELLHKRKNIVETYKKKLDNINVKLLKLNPDINWNYSYFPVIFESEKTLLQVMSVLEANNIFPRRYFYPSLNTLPYVENQSCPVSESISKCVLCLPIGYDLSQSQLNNICKIIKANV